MSRKKYLALFVAVVMMLGILLTGCSSGKKQSSTTSSSSEGKSYDELVKKLPTLKYLTDDQTQAKINAQVFQQMWKKNLGVNVEIETVPFKTRLERMNKYDYQIVMAGWAPDYNDPMTFMDLWTSWSANNNSGWTNSEYDNLIKDAQNTNDNAKRMEDFKKAEKLLLDEMPIGPVYYRYISYSVKPDVQGLVRRFVGGDVDFYWTSTKSGTLRYNLGEEPPQMDPQQTQDAVSMNVINAVMEGLMRYDQNGKVMPGIAESYTVSKDGLTYTFKLRDAKWSNGDPVTAQDFEYAWKRALDPKLGAIYAYIMYPIKNAEAYNTKKITDPNQVGVKALDAKTLQVTLERPLPYFPDLTAFATYMPLNQKFYETVKDKYGSEPDKMLYDGPWVIKSWNHQQKMVLEKNPNYWNKDAIKLNKIEFSMVNDRNTELNMFLTGQLDVAQVASEQFDRVKKAGYEIKSFSDGSSWYFQFNTKDPVLKNANIRKALTLAVDRNTFVKDILKNDSKPATGYVPDIMWGNKDTFRKEAGDLLPSSDVKQARELLIKGIKELGLDK
ncbi:ABC transporter substrate-binding protein [Caldanaerobius polysaccharolyticus]|uniref:ABC transporter substrate-binding protein n=1 Tax=Caldanaerobius polysaccharolyticus TaxID=44256 RepID=UPI000689F505|nr:ABC transporter substrate-binding protein [Caldanaerobius polysaccharolyticus]